ncbi:MAG: hypothetical protein NXI04_23755 [Planctomycetaceae bacterium]|nr:hypothetical protein [Planctomycetaceae bacterium]
MKLHVWSNVDGYFLSRPERRSRLVELEFDPHDACRQCGERVLSVSTDNSNICPWCDSGANRPKILPYQEQEIIRLLKKQSDENKDWKSASRRVIANRATEKDVRDYLDVHGFYGSSARFISLELAAIERPGWVQVFNFHAHLKTRDGRWVVRYGICRTDERTSLFEVTLHEHKEGHSAALRTGTRAMITRDRRQQHWSMLPLLMLFLFVVGVASVGAILAPEPNRTLGGPRSTADVMSGTVAAPLNAQPAQP